MSISIATGDEISEAEESLLVNDIVRRSVDFNGRPSHRSKSGGWKSASFIIGTIVKTHNSFSKIKCSFMNNS